MIKKRHRRIWGCTQQCNTAVSLYKVKKQLRLTKKSSTNKAELKYLLEDEFEAEPRHRIVISPWHRYQALLAVHAHEHWGVQRTMQRVRLVFYWPGWRKDTSIFVTEWAGRHHRKGINLKNVELSKTLQKKCQWCLVYGSCWSTNIVSRKKMYSYIDVSIF